MRHSQAKLHRVGQKKLIRFAEVATFPNVLQYPKDMAGQWKHFFGNEHPIVLELACGKGEYALGLARLYPQRNYIGIDLKGNRIWVGAKKALQEGLNQVAFIRSQIDKITDYFAAGEVSEIWITFPDPQLRASRAKKRLTHPAFLRRYQQILRPGGYIHLKTDSPDLYRFTKRVVDLYGLDLLEDYDDVYGQPALKPEWTIRTHYEGLDIAGSRRVHYLRFSLPADLDPNKDVALAQWVKEQAASAGEAAGE
jgi:tRNA (guanine-N7-)-methyltransferase